jgi:hypothetical protein
MATKRNPGAGGAFLKNQGEGFSLEGPGVFLFSAERLEAPRRFDEGIYVAGLKIQEGEKVFFHKGVGAWR